MWKILVELLETGDYKLEKSYLALLGDRYCKFENHQKILATVYGHPSFAPTEPGTN